MFNYDDHIELCNITLAEMVSLYYGKKLRAVIYDGKLINLELEE